MKEDLDCDDVNYNLERLAELAEQELPNVSFGDIHPLANAIRRGMDNMQPSVRSDFVAAIFRQP
jgi:hypothetical protein